MKSVVFATIITAAVLFTAPPALAIDIDGWIKSDTCFVANAPRGSAKVVGIIKKKAAVTVQDVGGGWLKIVYAPVRDINTGKYIDCKGCYIKKDTLTTKLGRWN